MTSSCGDASAPAPDAPARPWLTALPFALATALAALALVPSLGANPRLAASFAGTGVAVLLGLGAIRWRSRRSGAAPGVVPVPPNRAHYVQAGVQVCIYAYWGLYWTDVYSAIPLIVAQILFVYAFEALVVWSRGRAWQLGCGPLPIILSTNVFLWFREDWFFLQFLMIAAAVLGKEFVKWERDGKRVHVFNPSAFALCLASVLLLATGTTELTTGVEIATTLYRPPHIYLEIFLLGLIVQFFFSTTLITLSAAAVLVALNLVYTEVTGVYHFVDANIPAAVFLGFHLLVTDPKTSPRTGVGKVLFGGFYGLAIWVLYGVLGSFGLPQFYDKLLPIPILNLSVRLIDHVADHGLVSRLTGFERRFSSRRVNLASMGVWASLFVAMLSTGFVEARHAGNSVEFWLKAFEERKPGAGEKLLTKLELRSEAGSGSASNLLGTFYVDGRLVRRDPEVGAVYFARACELGNLPGCTNVARQFLATGLAFSPGIVELAFGHLEAAARGEGDAEPAQAGVACHLVGSAYLVGRGRPHDPERAVDFFEAGALLGDGDSCKSLTRRLLSGQRADERAAAAAGGWLRQASEAGDGEAALLLSYFYLNGVGGLPVDLDLARAQLERACALGSSEACQLLERTSR